MEQTFTINEDTQDVAFSLQTNNNQLRTITTYNNVRIEFSISSSIIYTLNNCKLRLYRFDTGERIGDFNFSFDYDVYNAHCYLNGFQDKVEYVMILVGINNYYMPSYNYYNDNYDIQYYRFSEYFCRFSITNNGITLQVNGGVKTTGNSYVPINIGDIFSYTKRKNIYIDHLQIHRLFNINVSNSEQTQIQGGCIAEDYLITALIKEATQEVTSNTALYIYNLNNTVIPIKIIKSINFGHANGLTYNKKTGEVCISSTRNVISNENNVPYVYKIALTNLLNTNYNSDYYMQHFNELFIATRVSMSGIACDNDNSRYISHDGSHIYISTTLAGTKKCVDGNLDYYNDNIYVNQDIGTNGSRIFIGYAEDTTHLRLGTNNRAIYFYYLCNNVNTKPKEPIPIYEDVAFYLFTLDFASVHLSSGMQYVIDGELYSSWECEWIELIDNDILLIGASASYNSNNVNTQKPAIFTLDLKTIYFNNQLTVANYINSLEDYLNPTT